MFEISKLKEKKLAELQEIAQELKISKFKTLKKLDLVYKILEKDKDVAKLAHRRLYDALTSHGITRMDEADPRCAKLFGGDSLRTYDYFQTKFFEFSNLESGEMDPPAFLVHLKLPKASLATRQVKVHN